MYFTEAFLESIPQFHIILTISYMSRGKYFMSTINDTILFIVTFTTSVLSAALGMSKYLKLGPCRLLPKNGWCGGFPWLMLSMASTLVGKGITFAHPLSFGRTTSFFEIILGLACTYAIPLLYVCEYFKIILLLCI